MQASIIVICKDDIGGLYKTLESIQHLADEVMLYDVTQTNDLENIAGEFKATLRRGEWRGFGHVRYDAVKLVKHDWILLLHAGEVLDKDMYTSINRIDISKTMVAYRMRFRNFIGKQWMRFGNEGGHSSVRMGNRKYIHLFNDTLQEEPLRKSDIDIIKLNGHIQYSSLIDLQQYSDKAKRQAMIAAVKYHRQGKRGYLFNLYLSPLLNFITTYFFKLGFLDGRNGLACASIHASYSYLKYKRLIKLNKGNSIINGKVPRSAYLQSTP
jgi:hypothetical protein